MVPPAVPTAMTGVITVGPSDSAEEYPAAENLSGQIILLPLGLLTVNPSEDENILVQKKGWSQSVPLW
jgi:hypothetical protein